MEDSTSWSPTGSSRSLPKSPFYTPSDFGQVRANLEMLTTPGDLLSLCWSVRACDAHLNVALLVALSKHDTLQEMWVLFYPRLEQFRASLECWEASSTH
eukprot:6018896-Amphidinium_carterae.1